MQLYEFDTNNWPIIRQNLIYIINTKLFKICFSLKYI